MSRVDVKGPIVPNNFKRYYDYFKMDSTCPKDVRDVINETQDGETIDVYVNSPGGVIDVGSEIYTMLKEESLKRDVRIHVVGEACSAASIISMASWCEMADTSLMMIHCVSTYGGGNHADFEHTAEMLRTADEALCNAYVSKSGMSKEEALELMNHETWLTAEKAKELGLIDAIMFENSSQQFMTNATPGFTLPTEEQMEAIDRALLNLENVPEEPSEAKNIAEMQKQKLNLLRIKQRKIH